jgi:hypothetical protein
VGVAGEIAQYFLRPAERVFAIDDPLPVAQWSQISGEDFAVAGIGYPDFTVYNGNVLFQGDDASAKVGLWVTDGTAGGTSELGGIGDTGIVGAGFRGLTCCSKSNGLVSEQNRKNKKILCS